MSVRPKAAFEAAQSFSLREVLSRQQIATPTPAANPNAGLKFNLESIKFDESESTQLPAPSPQVQQFPNRMNFTFKFSGKQQQPPAFVEKTARMAEFTTSNLCSGPFSAQKSDFISKGQENAKVDVMRLTAYVDELSNRLKKAQSRLEKTEFQLTRTSQVLCRERQVAEQTLATYKQDLALSHENEQKLRSEISADKKKTVLQETAFNSSVGAALESDEKLRLQQLNIDELDTKVKALGEFKTTLEADVAKLTSLRDSAEKNFDEVKTSLSLVTTRVVSISAEMAVARKELDATKAENAELLSEMANVKMDEDVVKERMEALKSSRIRAEEETSAAKSALQAMLLEHGEAARKRNWQHDRISELQTKEAAALESLARVEARLEAQRDAVSQSLPVEAQEEAYESDDEPIDPPLAPRLAPRRKARVTGAVAPNRELCTNIELPVPHTEQSHVAAVAAIDAPLDMVLRRLSFAGSENTLLETSAIAGEEDTAAPDAQEEMINAVVTDLKEKLTEISKTQPAFRMVAPLV